MIINTGGRTDTVQYFTPWLLKRFEEGFVFVRNPMFPQNVTKYSLTPEFVDCVVFCSKNYRPILPELHRITERFNTYFHYTITAYGRDVEPGVPSIDESMETLLELEKQVGKERIAWRYDPVLLTEKYTSDVHFKTFRYMAEKLSGHVDRCIFSFVEMYKKLERNMKEISPLSKADKDLLAKGLGDIARDCGLPIQTCACRDDYSAYGIGRSGCMTLEILGKANGVRFRNLKHSGMRANCGCIESHDIGEYDTCLNGCKYCYANRTPEKAHENFHMHDPASPLLLGHLKETDILRDAKEKSYLAKDFSKDQPELFPLD